MKLLLDNNLSPKLVPQLANLYPDSNHVALMDLGSANDLTVWEKARFNDFCLVTKDSDFNELLAKNGFPPKIIWIRIGNCTTKKIAELLQIHHEKILQFNQDMQAGLLEIQ